MIMIFCMGDSLFHNMYDILRCYIHEKFCNFLGSGIFRPKIFHTITSCKMVIKS